MDWKNELQTRKEKIDVMLKEQGWDIGDCSKVILEVDTKQSNFKTRKYLTVDETLKNEEESKYADYLLLDSKGKPLVVIEAKRTSKDPILGQKQAEMYAEDIKSQTNEGVFIFLSNGYEIWFWNIGYENPRMVKGFHNQQALERIKFQNKNKKNFKEIPIRKEIINRDYQIQAVEKVCEGIEKGKRKFLLVQATGTGKTRVSMAIADRMLKSKRAQKILFLADRKALRDQAYSAGFETFFPNEAKQKIFTSSLEKTSRLYASTIQTFMECYKQFSPGDFDVIISDEAHRSIYNKWKDVFTYFDAIQIGLTATPADIIDRDTFRFFGCEGKSPTYLYTYKEAVEDGWLAKFNVYSASTHFQIEGIRPEEIPKTIQDELAGDGIDKSELDFEGTDIEKKVIVKGTNEALVKEFMDTCLLDDLGLPAKTIIFAISKKHAKRLWEAFEKLYPEYKGKLARMIISEDSRADEILKDFKTKSFPRIAISVDMLDTGIDVPEVCNLVFAKPVFSKIKFWQMIGRGTRHEQTCKHKEWLPAGTKTEFLCLDFWKVFDYFSLKPEGKETTQSEAVYGRIFRTRLEKYELFKTKKDKERLEQVKNKLLQDIEKLPKDSIAIKEKTRDIEIALSKTFWENIAIKPTQFLKAKINPLMRYQQNINLDEAYFILRLEKLGIAILLNDEKAFEKLKKEIAETVMCLPKTINDVKKKEELIDKILTKEFWEKITYEDTETIIQEIAPLMRYKQSEPRPQIILDIDDLVQERKTIEFGPEQKSEYIDDYKSKVEKKIKQLANDHPTIKKIKENKQITEKDLKKLEQTLNSPDLFITEENLQKVYSQSNGTLTQFIKKILGLYEFQKPEELIDDEFKTYIVENSDELNSAQINFLRILKTVFSKTKHLDYTDFFEPPFTNIPKAPTPLFKEEKLKEMVKFCKKIETEVKPRR
jgi:type I restriction enzyme, R subunit